MIVIKKTDLFQYTKLRDWFVYNTHHNPNQTGAESSIRLFMEQKCIALAEALGKPISSTHS